MKMAELVDASGIALRTLYKLNEEHNLGINIKDRLTWEKLIRLREMIRQGYDEGQIRKELHLCKVSSERHIREQTEMMTNGYSDIKDANIAYNANIAYQIACADLMRQQTNDDAEKASLLEWMTILEGYYIKGKDEAVR